MDGGPRLGDQSGSDARASRKPRPTPHTALAPLETPDSLDPDNAERDRRLRRARFLADLFEARELRKRVAPRRARSVELRARLLRTFRY